MENAQLVSLSRQIALQRQMDVVANNMANLNTIGFKGEKVLFEEFVMPGAKDDGFPAGQEDVSFTQDWATMHDMTAGAIRQTGNPLDAALDGEGFFTVNTPNGPRYTRNGAFKLDGTGTLVTAQGNPVAGSGGTTIRFASGETDISIAPDGTVFSSAGTKGKLQIATFNQPQNLTREANDLFVAPAGAQPTTPAKTRVVGGAVEGSNVSGVTEMTNMIRVSRAYEMVAQLVNRQDQLRASAIQRLGNLNA